jgi:Spy/CpxP family protein refolding chaperone
MNNPTQSPPPRRWLAAAALASAFAIGGVTMPLIAASAQDATQGAMHHIMGGAGGTHAMAMAHVSKMLDEVGASAEQKSRIETILHAGFAPLADVHHDMAQTHAALHTILSAPTVDRAALEQLRAAEIARIDAASRSLTKALADAIEVLTPEQRAKLGRLIAEHHAAS